MMQHGRPLYGGLSAEVTYASVPFGGLQTYGDDFCQPGALDGDWREVMCAVKSGCREAGGDS